MQPIFALGWENHFLCRIIDSAPGHRSRLDSDTDTEARGGKGYVGRDPAGEV